MEQKCKQCGKTVSEVGPIDSYGLCWDCWWHLMEKLHREEKMRDKQQKKEV